MAVLRSSHSLLELTCGWLATPTFMLTATGFGLIVYAAFVWLCDAGSFRLGVLRTSGQNPLIAYLLDGWIGGLVSDIWPKSGGWPWALAGSAVRFGLTYGLVRLLEWRRIYLRRFRPGCQPAAVSRSWPRPSRRSDDRLVSSSPLEDEDESSPQLQLASAKEVAQLGRMNILISFYFKFLLAEVSEKRFWTLRRLGFPFSQQQKELSCGSWVRLVRRPTCGQLVQVPVCAIRARRPVMIWLLGPEQVKVSHDEAQCRFGLLPAGGFQGPEAVGDQDGRMAACAQAPQAVDPQLFHRLTGPLIAI
jgi:hypothetical protein